jgi:pyrroline-5-carboxylate reductase
VSDINPHALSELGSLGIHVTRDNGLVASKSQILFLCTKPDTIVPALREVSSHLRPNTLLISIAAGLPLGALEAAAPPGTRVIRVMPNTPALVGASASAYTLGSACTDEDAKVVQTLLESIGTGQCADSWSVQIAPGCMSSHWPCLFRSCSRV